jgi:hypothetical protein
MADILLRMTEPDAVDPSRFRVSDAEREQALQRLQVAVGEGRLDLSEFSTRTDLILASKTRGELDRIFADLPASPVAPPATAGEPALELRPKHSALQRQGNWVVPGSILIDGKHGSVSLDFTHAQWSTPEVRVDIDTKHTKIELIVAPGTWVDPNGLENVYSKVRDRRGGQDNPHSPKRVRLFGRMKYSNLTIRPTGKSKSWWEWLEG